MFDKKPKCYVARAMTGRIKEEVVVEAQKDKEFLEKIGFNVLCPVSMENVSSTKEILNSSKESMDKYWPRDKQMIRDAHIIFNVSPHLSSLGVIREHGLARYGYWKKVISIFPNGKIPVKAAICHYEDDFVTDSLLIAAGDALRTHGTYFRRLKWRLGIYNRCFIRNFFIRLLFWFQ